jgi:hypothetical protein
LPGHKVHRLIDKIFFGKTYPKVHRRMDEPYLYLKRNHRILFHDMPSAYLIAKDAYPEDPNAILAAHYHIVYDEICSKDPGYRKFLEQYEIISNDSEKKGLKNKKTKKIRKKEDSFVSDLKKLAKLKELIRKFHSG